MRNIYTFHAVFHGKPNVISIDFLRFPALMTLMVLMITVKGWGQTTVFTDDFDRSGYTSPQSGGTPTATYITGTGSNGAITMRLSSGSDYALQLAGLGIAGNTFTYLDNSAFYLPYSSSSGLTENSGIITWYFNEKYFGSISGNYRPVIILAASGNDFNSGSGYAVYYRKSTSLKFSLARFSGGVQGTITDVIPEATSNDITSTTDYVSIMVKYDPSTDNWSMYTRDDGGTAFTLPWTGTLTQHGSTVMDNTYTSSSYNLKYSGFYYTYLTAVAGSYKTIFDNFRVTEIATSAPSIQSTNLVFSLIAQSSMTTGWTNGNGYKRIVKMNTTNSFTNPVNGAEPTANPVYGGSGEQVVYDGTGNTVNVTGLSASTEYWYRVYEYYYGASLSPIYLTSTATDNPKSATTSAAPLLPTVISPTATAITNNTATLGGNITSDGGASISARGTVWKTTSPVTISDNPLAEGGTTTGVFTHSRTTLPAKSHIFYAAYATNSVGTTLSSEGNFYTLADEPTTHVTNFAANPITGNYTSLNLTWLSATGADGYLIVQRLGSSSPGTAPTDATGYAIGSTLGTGTIAAVVSSGATTSQVISGLTPSTQYTFRIYPFGYDGSNASTYNYRTVTTIPTTSGTTNTPPPTDYTWTGATDNSWIVATNWSPNRTVPYTNDMLHFNGGGSITITNVPTQTISQLLVSNNTTLELQSASTAILTINGGTGVDFDVPSGSAMNLTQATAITIALATGATGTIGGSMNFSNAAHKLTGFDASSITFQNGSTFTAGTLFSGNAFGTINNLSVVFAGGSTYIQSAGSNPFGASQPGSAVVFQTGSVYKFNATVGGPSYSGRTYGDFENNSTLSQDNQGSGTMTCDNYTVTSGIINWDFSGGIVIKGNISVSSAATLTFGNATKTTNLTLSGSAAQTISGTGTMIFGANGTLTVNNPTGVTLNSKATLNNLTIASGTFTVASGASLITNGTINGNVIVERTIDAWTDATHGWHFLSSPVAVQAIDPAFTNLTPGNYDFFAWSEPDNMWVNFKNTSAPPVWNTANVLGGTSGSLNFIPGKGYLAEYVASGTKQFNGTLNTGDISLSNLSLSAGTNKGWHLLGNPFPCALIWEPGTWGLSNVNATAKIWKESSASYVDVNISPPGNPIIPALNGFMVEVTGGTNALTIPISARVHDATFWYKSADAPYIQLIANDPTGKTSQESIIRFEHAATTGFDPAFDSHFLQGYAPQFYSVAGMDHLSTNVLPDAGGTVQIPFDFIKNNGGNFTIEAKSISNITGPVILNDLKTNATQDLTQNPVYAFSSVQGDNPGRFMLAFSHVGIGETKKTDDLNVFTNGNTIVVTENGGVISGNAFVYNMMGQLVMQQKLTGANQSTFRLNACTGYYLVKVVTNHHVYSDKVFIN